ncbi:SDR family NAD(P)-dependent oxidoreductase [Marinomonas transparens]|uniref:SDR family oxidoreductase n=1 Tax=Marinomonas transparens TaxID=2795388 RepID=A0A934MUL7_9GAMM|nr:SDR family oxidoreductase [Marinomonas transparens]MBJ7536094.1 SDR family oxidoreductase [Marinomonas transparens]
MTQKTFLITGATSGIGFALAQHCIDAGHRVIITGRDQVKLGRVSKELGVTAYFVDNANLEQIRQLGESLVAEGVMLDGVVLNAGIFYPDAFVETTPDAFDATMAINTKGPFFTLQTLLPSLKNPASVVFISSIAVTKGFEGCAVYAASKAAFEAVVRVANMELAGRGIRINSVRPGVTATEIQAKAGMTKEQEALLFDSLRETPLGRELMAEDHLEAIMYLLGDGSNALRNAVIEVEGGYLL